MLTRLTTGQSSRARRRSRPWRLMKMILVMFTAGASSHGVMAQAGASDTEVAATEALEAEPAEGRAAESQVQVTVRATGIYSFPADIESTPADVRVWRTGFHSSIAAPMSETSRAIFAAGYEYNGYDFDEGDSLIPGLNEPFGDVHILDLSLNGVFQVDESWSWAAGVGGRFAGEADVDVSDAATFGGQISVHRHFSETLSAGFGVRAATEIEDDGLIAPIVALDWTINDRWRLITRSADSIFRYDFGGELIYAMNDELEAAFGVGWQSRRFRLEDDGPANGRVVEDEGVPVYVALRSRPNPGLELSIGAGVEFARKMSFDSRQGAAGRSYDVDPALLAGLRVSVTF